MSDRFLHTSAGEAVVFAVKNALTLAPVQAAVGGVTFLVSSMSASIDGFLPGTFFGPLGPRLTATGFALIGALWRWHRFKLSTHAGVSGCVFSMVLAFIIGDSQVPYAEAFTQSIAKESIPMMNGFLMGLFGLLLVTGVQDFMSAYRGKKEGDGK